MRNERSALYSFYDQKAIYYLDIFKNLVLSICLYTDLHIEFYVNGTTVAKLFISCTQKSVTNLQQLYLSVAITNFNDFMASYFIHGT